MEVFRRFVRSAAGSERRGEKVLDFAGDFTYFLYRFYIKGVQLENSTKQEKRLKRWEKQKR